MTGDEGFLSRWSRRKTQGARGEAPAAEPLAHPPASPPSPAQPGRADASATRIAADSPVASSPRSAAGTVADAGDRPPAAPTPPPPTIEEARALTPEADFTRFVNRDVDPQVRNTALKTLFRDPRFNVMDGLDIYIDDYSIPDPLQPGVLARMAQSAALGLLRDTPPRPTGAGAAAGRAVQAGATDTDQAATDAAADAGTDTATEAAADPAPHSDPAAAASAVPAPDHENPDLRLQPLDAAGHPGDREGAAGHPGRQR